MAKAIKIHKSAVSSIMDLLRYRRLKTLRLENFAGLFTHSKRLVIITDSTDITLSPYTQLPLLEKTFGAENLLLITLNNLLQEKHHPRHILTKGVTGPATSPESEEFKQLIEHLQQFKADTYVIRMNDPHSTLRRILLRTAPPIRISLGDTVPYPFSNITVTESMTELQSYL